MKQSVLSQKLDQDYPSQPNKSENVICMSHERIETGWPHISMVSCQTGPTRHAYAWKIGPFWQDTLDISISKLDRYWFRLPWLPQKPFCEVRNWRHTDTQTLNTCSVYHLNKYKKWYITTEKHTNKIILQTVMDCSDSCVKHHIYIK